MNFDELFCYTSPISRLNAEIDVFNAKISALNTQITYYNTSIVGFSNVTSLKITALTTELNLLTTLRNNYQSVVNEMNAITNLDESTKATLLFYYESVNTNAKDFMMRMLFNYPAALTNTTITNLQTDIENTIEKKREVANIIYYSIPVTSIIDSDVLKHVIYAPHYC